MIAGALCAMLWTLTSMQAASLEETVAAYGEAWNEPDAVKRAALLEMSFAEEGVYEDPQGRYEGRDALAEGIGGFLTENPGAGIVLTSGVDAHHGKIRFRWEMVGADGRTILVGMDYGELDEDGRIARIVGFFGPFPDASNPD